tara:strand:+ start:318 stop:533 length:216 start_codon:yes stop_codon:yes gene_type:complete
MVVFSQPNDLETKRYLEILKRVTDMFGNFGIVISDIYHDDSKDGIEVVDLWFSKGVVLYMIPVDRLKIYKL